MLAVSSEDRSPARILVVDDEELNRDLCSRSLELSGFAVTSASNGRAALAVLAAQEFDLVLLDYMMPGMNGVDVVKLLRAPGKAADLAIIMVTAVTEGARIAEALDAGADDYITKPVDFPVALARIRTHLQKRQLASELRRSEQRYSLASRSAQEGLWEWDFRSGRIYYSAEWKQLLGFAEDEVGGMPSEWLDRIHPDDRAGFDAALERHLRGHTAGGANRNPSATHETPRCEIDILECEQRLRIRDGSYCWMAVRAMSQRDAHGDPVRLAGTLRAMRDQPRRNLQLESDLRRGLRQQEFEVFYQPRIRLTDGTICGFEALVRWRHPERGLVPPNDFIPIAEESGLILEIGQVVLREACRQMYLWQQQFPREPRLDIAVNLSARQCAEPGIVAKVAQVLDDTGLSAACLHLELTESLLLDDMEAARQVLVDLKAMGVGLKIDDFGAGYSSLRYLRELPFDTLKIDRSFTMALHLDKPESAEMVKTILAMARNLHLDVIAEGVERAEHVSELRRLGCEFGQGFYFSKPVSADEIALLLASPAGSPASTHTAHPRTAQLPLADWDTWNRRLPHR